MKRFLENIVLPGILVVVLKAIEIGSIIGLWWLLCKIGSWICQSSNMSADPFWAVGIVPLVLMVACMLIMGIFYEFLKMNLRLARKIIDRMKGKR